MTVTLDYFSIKKSGAEKERRIRKQKEIEEFNYFAYRRECRRRRSSQYKSTTPTSPPDHNRAKKSNRASYPQSKREKQEHPEEHRSRRVATSPKSVHFNDTAGACNPFNAQDSAVVDQIHSFLGVQDSALVKQSPTIPHPSFYSVTARPVNAVHCTALVPRNRSLAVVKVEEEEFIGPVPLTREARLKGVEISDDDLKPRRKSKNSSDSDESEDEDEVDHNEDEDEDAVDVNEDAQTPAPESSMRTETPNKRYSSSHYETHSQRQSIIRSESDTSTSTRPRGQSLDETSSCVQRNVTWLPANEVLKKPETKRMDSSIPVAEAPEDALHRSGAQRLPAVPRHRKLLKNMKRMWGKNSTETKSSSVAAQA